MKKASPSIVFLLFLSFSNCGFVSGMYYRAKLKSELRKDCPSAGPAHGHPRLTHIGKIPVVHLYGDATARGTQYGTLLREPLRSLDNYLMAMLPVNFVNKLLAQAYDLEKAVPGSIRDELRAVSKASNVSYWHLVALNVIPKLYCSTIAAWDSATETGELIMGRNAEYDGMGLSDRGTILCVHHIDSSNDVLTINMVGMIGAFTGCNCHGVCFANMLVFNSKWNTVDTAGVAIQLDLKVAAEQSKTAREMIRYLTAKTPIIPMIVMVADTSGASIVELTSRGYSIREGSDGVIASSNYFLSDTLYSYALDCPRHAALNEIARTNYGTIDLPVMKRALARSIIKKLNLQAVVFMPQSRKAYISVNKVPAAKGPYVEIDMDDIFECIH